MRASVYELHDHSTMGEACILLHDLHIAQQHLGSGHHLNLGCMSNVCKVLS